MNTAREYEARMADLRAEQSAWIAAQMPAVLRLERAEQRLRSAVVRMDTEQQERLADAAERIVGGDTWA